MTPSIEVDYSDLERVLGRLQAETPRDLQASLDYVAVKAAKSASVAAKPAAKTRPVYPNPEFAHLLNARRGQYKAARRAGRNMARYYRWGADVFRQPPKKSPVMRYANAQETLAKVRHVGLARRSWAIASAVMAAQGKGGEPPAIETSEADAAATIIAARSALVERTMGTTDGVVMVGSALRYMSDAYPGIGDNALATAMRGIEGHLDRKAQEAIDRADPEGAYDRRRERQAQRRGHHRRDMFVGGIMV